mgnify:FL=1
MLVSKALGDLDHVLGFTKGTLEAHDVGGMLGLAPTDDVEFEDLLHRIHDDICTGGTWDAERVTDATGYHKLWSSIGWCLRAHWLFVART